MLVAVAVVSHGCGKHRRLDVLQGHRGAWSTRGGDQACDGVEGREESPPIAPGNTQQMVARFGREFDCPTEPARIGDRTIKQDAEVIIGERLQSEYDAAREQRRDDGEARVLGGCRDEGDPAVLHGGQQRILLRLAEAVHLVDEEHGATALHAERGLGLVDDLAHVFDTCGDG